MQKLLLNVLFDNSFKCQDSIVSRIDKRNISMMAGRTKLEKNQSHIQVSTIIPIQTGPESNLDLPSDMFVSLTTWVMAWLWQD
jgi:hypothetical protein